MRRAWFWLRWSGRELRRRWMQVAVIALVVAIGTGVYAGLSSMMEWRRVSYDASYEVLNAHDLRVTLAEDGFVPEGDLVAALGAMEHPAWVAAAEERLIAPTQVDASTGGATVLVPGRIVGIPVPDGGPRVDAVHVTGGRGLADGAVLESHFSEHYELPARGTVQLAGGVPLPYVGTGLTPEYFMVTSGQGDFLAEANFAVVFVPLADAQGLVGRDGRVNDLVIALSGGVDRDVALAEVKRALKAHLPRLATEVTTIEDDPAYRLLYGDLRNDEGTIDAMAFLILAAAAFAAFNLTSRIVEAQRREIGIGMALGVRRRAIALRPLLVGAEIAALGVAFGIGMGFLVGTAMRGVLESIQPLPVWRTPFQVGPFVGAAAVGFLLPFAATAWPVWRAVRVNPVDAIRTGHLAAKGGGLAPLLQRLRLPGRSLGQIPLRNVLRAPRRTALTALGIGAAIVSMVAVLGAVDTFEAILDRGSAELRRGARDRVVVTLAGFQPVDGDLVRAIDGSPVVGATEPTVIVGAWISGGGEEVEVRVQALDLASEIWHPSVDRRADPGDLPGVVLAREAANDLGVVPGDEVLVRHPVRTAGSSFRIEESRMRVLGLHPNPMRFLAYVDLPDAARFGLAGLTNELQVVPADGASVGDVKRSLFSIPGVAVVQEADATLEATSDILDRFTGIFRVVEGFMLLLALLIALNAASINADERAREHATMVAYGVRIRTLLRMAVVEGSVVGVLGTLIGLGLGFLALGWIMGRSAAEIPELELLVTMTPASIVATLFFGVVVVGLAPLFTARKLRRMDVPSTLRVME
ncbi:MAG TPA: FtsX-like permease family protein [Actinomycetota bacterium]